MQKYPVGKYAGERPAKTLVRAFTYLRFLDTCDVTRFLEGHHIVLGGAGGDILLLLSLGVPAHHIHAADIDPQVTRTLRNKYPGVRVFDGDVLEMATHMWEYDVVTVNLDFCGKLSRALLDKAAAMRRLFPYETYFSATLYCSRETEEEVKEYMKKAAALSSDKASNRADAFFWMMSERIGFFSFKEIAAVGYLSSGTSLKGNASNRLMVTLSYTKHATKYPSRVNCRADELDEKSLAFGYAGHGFSSREIAPILGRPRQCVAAWFAHETRKKRNR